MFHSKKLTKKFLQEQNLTIYDPDTDSFLYQAFQNNLDCAKQALSTSYLQGIKHGNLDPDTYGAFIIQDTYYCFHGVATLEKACDLAIHEPTMRVILQYIKDAYKGYCDHTLEAKWHLISTGSITVRPSLKAYTEFEYKVATSEPLIYTIVALLPCYYLWSWLALQMKDYDPSNIYKNWIEDNLDMDPSSILSHFLECYRKASPSLFDEAKAMDIFKKSMNFELMNFRDAI